MKKPKPNPKLGRPIDGAERKRAYNITLEPSVAEQLRELGNGNLSAGITRAAVAYREISQAL